MQSLIKLVVLIIRNHRHTTAQALTGTARRCECDSRDTVVDKLVDKLLTGHILVAEGEEEAVRHILIAILVVDDVEAILYHNLLYALRTAGILACVLHIVELAVRCCTEHRCQGILRRVRNTRREHIEDVEDKVAAELTIVAIALCEALVATVLKF